MKRTNTAIGVFVGTLLASVSAVLAFIVWRYLSGHASKSLAAGLIGLVGAGAGVFVGTTISRARSRRWPTAALGISLCAALSIFGSFAAARVSYSRFGLTVYGVIPIPVLDVTVSADGLLWFRDKTHLITLDEVRALLGPEVKVIVIGTGWHELAQVEEGVEKLLGVSVEVLSTADAFSRYNRLKAEGVKVALLAHTTC